MDDGGPGDDQGVDERGRTVSRRPYVSSAICSSDILSSGDDGPHIQADRSDGSGTPSSHTSQNVSAGTKSSKKSKRLSFGRKPRAAEVTWADKKSIDAAKYTFFRDPTPPPPEEKVYPRGAGLDEATYDYRYDYVAPPAPLPRAERRCGMRKRTLWIVLAAILVAIVVAVGVGVGVGASRKGSSSDTESSGSSDRFVQKESLRAPGVN